MIEKYIIGIMSGTSCDGLDITFCKYTKLNNKYCFNLLYAKTYIYDSKFSEILQNCIYYDIQNILKLDVEFGYYIGNKINEFIFENNIKRVDYIASHGHTVFHNPKENYTYQIGNGNAIKSICNIDTIYDFRTMDVCLGGQGAPLVPIGDLLLFADYKYCINIGGIANISIKNNHNEILANDVCFANMGINYLCKLLGLNIDLDGKIAKDNELDMDLFNSLMELNFSKQSLGKELFDSHILPILNNSNIIVENKITTFTHYIAKSISLYIVGQKSVIITGGGAYNSYLVQLINKYSNTNVYLPDNEIIEFKESIIFGFLGFLKFLNEPNCLSSVTGAKCNNVGGIMV